MERRQYKHKLEEHRRQQIDKKYERLKRSGWRIDKKVQNAGLSNKKATNIVVDIERQPQLKTRPDSTAAEIPNE